MRPARLPAHDEQPQIFTSANGTLSWLIIYIILRKILIIISDDHGEKDLH